MLPSTAREFGPFAILHLVAIVWKARGESVDFFGKDAEVGAVLQAEFSGVGGQGGALPRAPEYLGQDEIVELEIGVIWGLVSVHPA